MNLINKSLKNLSISAVIKRENRDKILTCQSVSNLQTVDKQLQTKLNKLYHAPNPFPNSHPHCESL